MGSSRSTSFHALVLVHGADDVADDRWSPLDVLVVGDGDVDDRRRPALRLVADPDDLAVAHVPRHPVRVAQLGDAQRDVLDGADRPRRCR